MTAAALSAALAAATGRAEIADAVPVTGGCINACFTVRQGGERFFVKLNRASAADAFAAEADGLEALAAAGLRVPGVIAHGMAEDHAFLVLEHLALGRPGADGFRALGRALAAAHRRPQPRFGWHRDNYIGATPQRNDSAGHWTSFWVAQRLQPQLALAAERGHRVAVDGLLEAVPRLLAGHVVRPAILHGDLWGGNAGFLEDGRPVVFDPAVYCGDAEADLAMTQLFGGFPPQFYEGYREVAPENPGYRLRRALYNLYHVLNHLNLFGRSYLGQAQSMIGELVSATK